MKAVCQPRETLLGFAKRWSLDQVCGGPGRDIWKCPAGVAGPQSLTPVSTKYFPPLTYLFQAKHDQSTARKADSVLEQRRWLCELPGNFSQDRNRNTVEETLCRVNGLRLWKEQNLGDGFV
jgi:hypothetical protein